MLDILPAFAATGALTLGLNGNEANILSRLLGLPEAVNVPATHGAVRIPVTVETGKTTVLHLDKGVLTP